MLKILLFYGGDAATNHRNELLAWLRGPHVQGVEALVVADWPPHTRGAVDDRVDMAIDWADAAIALLTPDPRAPYGAPNVMDEIGRWRGRRGKETLCILRQKNVPPYSNHDGIVYVGFNQRVNEGFELIRRFLASIAGGQPALPVVSSGDFVIADSGNIALLDGRTYMISRVTESGSEIELELGPLSSEGAANLRQLNPSHNGIGVAFKDTAFVAAIVSKKIEHRGSDTMAVIRLRDARGEYGGANMEMAWGGPPHMDADEIATRRASRILFDDPPPVKDNDLSSFIGPEMLIRGGGTAPFQVKRSPLPALLAQFPPNEEETWKLARLVMIHSLRLSDCVEQIHLLRLTIRGGALARVEFRGVRRQKYANQPAVSIEFDRNL